MSAPAVIPTARSVLSSVRSPVIRRFFERESQRWTPKPAGRFTRNPEGSVIHLLDPSVSPTSAGPFPNPFVTHRHPHTQRIIRPFYSLREQADLVKAAQEEGVLGLLPPGKKSGSLEELEGEARAKGVLREMIWVGGEEGPGAKRPLNQRRGKEFKGKKSERERPAKLKLRKERMDGMEKRIEEWKKAKAAEKAKIKATLPF